MTKKVPVKALRLGVDVEPTPSLWSFRRAERGQLTVDAGGLFFGSWSIPRLEVREAHWFIARDMPVPLMAILRVRTRAQVFEFALEPWRLSSSDLPFTVERIEFSILSRRSKLLLACAVAAGILAFAIAG